MNIPDFDDFWATLSPEQLANFFTIPEKKIYQMNSLSEENVSALISDAAREISLSSATYAIHLLRAYHNWLAKQLAQSP